MLKLIARRFALGVLTLWAVSVLIFVGTEILPGDVATAILGQSRTPETVKALRESLGLDRPAVVRYGDWLFHFAKGDIGKSLANQRDIGDEIRERLGNTLFLAGTAALVAVPLSIFLGLIAAIRQNSFFDRAINAATIVTISFPEFFIGYILIIFVSVQLDWFPSLATISSDSFSPVCGCSGSRSSSISYPASRTRATQEPTVRKNHGIGRHVAAPPSLSSLNPRKSSVRQPSR